VIWSGANGECTERASEVILIAVGRGSSREASWTQGNEVKKKKMKWRREKKRRGGGGKEEAVGDGRGQAVAVLMLSISICQM
jgi:hypothetical protein